MEIIKEISSSIWKVLPAYVANATPLLVIKLIKQGHPIDLNRNFIDEKPIFGPGKTIEGFFIGILIGTITGIIQDQSNILRAVTLSLGAMFGDLVGSFIKRRLNIRRGDPAPILDQLAFILGAIILSSYFENYEVKEAIMIVLITIPLHIFTNKLAYIFGLKKVPW